MSPSMASSVARAMPMRRGRKYVLPMSGMSPMRTNACTKVADSAAMRKSAASASEKPAPAATPLTAAMMGFSSMRMRRMAGA